MAIGRLGSAAVILLGLGLCACAAVGVVATSDPRKELGNAVALIAQGRSAPAERLIVAAIAQCEKSNDAPCVGEGDRVYGLFLSSSAVTRFRVPYQKHGFLDRSATWDTRYQASIVYFRRAGAIAKETDRYDILADVHYLVGRDFALLHDMASACAEFSESLDAHAEFQRRNPDTTAPIDGPVSFDEAVADIRRRIGCPGQSGPVRDRADAGKAIVLNIAGSADAASARDWGRFKQAWRDACTQAGAAVGVAVSMQEGEPKPTGESGTLVVVEVADYRYLPAGARKMFGAMTGNAFIHAQAELHDLRTGGVWSTRTYDTSSSAWQGVSAPMTESQLRWICHTIVAEITW